jgi:hypothetical protein
VSLYHVRIELREPGFELRIGPRDEPFLAGDGVTADNREPAVEVPETAASFRTGILDGTWLLPSAPRSTRRKASHAS